MPRGVTQSKANNVNIVTILDVRLDEYAAPPLKTALDQLISAEQVLIVVDFAAVMGMDAIALQTVTSALQAARRKGGDIRLANLNKQPSEIIRTSFPVPVFQIFGSVDEAVKSFQG